MPISVCQFELLAIVFFVSEAVIKIRNSAQDVPGTYKYEQVSSCGGANEGRETETSN